MLAEKKATLLYVAAKLPVERGWLSGDRAVLITLAVIELVSLIPVSHLSVCP
jgi:hypothetical protein